MQSVSSKIVASSIRARNHRGKHHTTEMHDPSPFFMVILDQKITYKDHVIVCIVSSQKYPATIDSVSNR